MYACEALHNVRLDTWNIVLAYIENNECTSIIVPPLAPVAFGSD